MSGIMPEQPKYRFVVAERLSRPVVPPDARCADVADPRKLPVPHLWPELPSPLGRRAPAPASAAWDPARGARRVIGRPPPDRDVPTISHPQSEKPTMKRCVIYISFLAVALCILALCVVAIARCW